MFIVTRCYIDIVYGKTAKYQYIQVFVNKVNIIYIESNIYIYIYAYTRLYAL